jgi:hypothetical protein
VAGAILAWAAALTSRSSLRTAARPCSCVIAGRAGVAWRGLTVGVAGFAPGWVVKVRRPSGTVRTTRPDLSCLCLTCGDGAVGWRAWDGGAARCAARRLLSSSSRSAAASRRGSGRDGRVVRSGGALRDSGLRVEGGGAGRDGGGAGREDGAGRWVEGGGGRRGSRLAASRISGSPPASASGPAGAPEAGTSSAAHDTTSGQAFRPLIPAN